LSTEAIKSVVLVTAGVLGIIALFVFLDASNELNRAEKAEAKYNAWANSPTGIESRRLQRDLDRIRREEGLKCYFEHVGPDYDASLDCPENMAPRTAVTPPSPLSYPTVWDYTIFSRAFRSDVSAALFEIHMEAVGYWEKQPAS
jgi:hypothetical protein